MGDEDFCVKCGHFPKQRDTEMYPDFCKECADRITNLLDKRGILNKLKRKLKIK